MPGSETPADVVLLSPDSSLRKFLAAAVLFLQETGLTHYFLEGTSYGTQIFSDLKNPHLRQCKVCIYIYASHHEAPDSQIWCADVIRWLEEHNPDARVFGYEIRVKAAQHVAVLPEAGRVLSPDELIRRLKKDLVED